MLSRTQRMYEKLDKPVFVAFFFFQFIYYIRVTFLISSKYFSFFLLLFTFGKQVARRRKKTPRVLIMYVCMYVFICNAKRHPNK